MRNDSKQGDLSELELATQERALEFAKKNKKQIARELTSLDVYMPEINPVSVFMAGSPGAGKTEASKVLLDRYSNQGAPILRIDPDELREKFDEYDGHNAWLFQRAVSLLVERIHDLALKNWQSFILDGTLANLNIATKNIERSLKRDRFVQIYYVYQDPRLAWEFVQAREKSEGRRILVPHFIEQYFAAREVVNKLKKDFGQDIRVDLLMKNTRGGNRFYEANIDRIDNHVSEKYTPETLLQAL